MPCKNCNCDNCLLSNRRTNKQNAALHLWFNQIAEALNEAGYDIKAVLSDGVDHPWTGQLVKELLWRKVQRAYLQKESTTRLRVTQDIDKVFDVINRLLGEKTGVYVPFPSIDELIRKQDETNTKKT